jgi:hypothetical protein
MGGRDIWPSAQALAREGSVPPRDPDLSVVRFHHELEFARPPTEDPRPTGPVRDTSPGCNSVSLVGITKDKLPTTKAQVAGGVVGAPLFITAFTAIGAKRPGYDWRRDPVSSLGIGEQGWPQRANFGLAGVLTLDAFSLRRVAS